MTPLKATMKLDECVVKSFVYGLRFGDREGPVQPRGWSGRPPGGQQGRQVFQIRDQGHALGGEHAATLQLPVLMLFQEHRSHQADDRGVVGEDADDAGSPFDGARSRAHLSVRR